MGKGLVCAVFWVLAAPIWMPAQAQMLEEKPASGGGDPLGAWEADETPLQVWAAEKIVKAFSPEFSGSVTGQLTLDSNGAYQADYDVAAQVKIASLLVTVDTSFVQSFQSSGTYDIASTDLILIHTEQGAEATVRDTLGFTVVGDSLYLVQPVPLGDYEGIVRALFPDAGPPLAVLGLRRTGGGSVGPEELTADFNADAKVDFGDFLAFAGHYDTALGDAGYDERFDLNGDNRVGFLDFLVLARQYGQGG